MASWEVTNAGVNGKNIELDASMFSRVWVPTGKPCSMKRPSDLSSFINKWGHSIHLISFSYMVTLRIVEQFAMKNTPICR